MSLFLELGSTTLVLYGILWLLFYPAGAALLDKRHLPHLRLPLGLCLGILIQGVIAVVLQMLGFSMLMRSILTTGLVFFALAAWVLRGKGGENEGYRSYLLPHCLLFLFLLLCVHSAAFPDGNLRSASAEVTQLLTGLPTDHLITYNTARFVVEGISPDIEVVPTWSVAERAPMAGLAVASLFHVLNLSENAHWLGSSPGIYYIFQTCMSFFNCLPLLSVFLLANVYLGRREAIISFLLLGISPFFLLNAIYPWPKMMMSFFFLTALALWLEAGGERRNYILSGILMAGAYLCHSIALFYIVGFFLFAFLTTYGGVLGRLLPQSLAEFWHRRFSDGCSFPRTRLSGILTTALSCALLLTPWFLFTAWLGASSRRLLYMHAFCILDYDVDAVPLVSAMGRYLSEFGVSGILYTRWSNLLYPLDPLPLIGDVYTHGLSLTYLLERLSHYSFYKLVFAYGPLGIPLILLGFLSAIRESRRLRSMSLILLSAFPFMLLIFGCANYLTNHIWVYPLFVGGAIWMACVYRLSFGALALAIHLGINIAIIVFGFWFGKQTSAYLHASAEYLMIQLGIMFAVVVVAGCSVCASDAALRPLATGDVK